MIKHIVLFKLAPSLREAEKQAKFLEIKNQLEALIPVIPELKKMTVGININPSETWDFSLEAIVEDKHDLGVYASHPAHQAILNNQIKPFLSERACVDYEF